MRNALSFDPQSTWRKAHLLLVALLAAIPIAVAAMPSRVSAAPVPVLMAAPCAGGSFLGFPKWHKYLNGVQTDFGCTPQLRKLSDIWLVALAILEIMLRLVALVSIFVVLYGGVMYMTSQGDPGSTKKARETVMNALIGVIIAVSATAVVSFIAGRFT
jgi:hypothetical protein